MDIRKLTHEDYNQVTVIYKQGIDTGMATFQTEITGWDEWNNSHLSHSRIVALIGNHIVGWAALSPVSNRCVYAGVGEVSIYIDEQYRGEGVGKTLLTELIIESEKNGLWTLQAGIFPNNVGSIKLHEACGFRQVGYREKIGQMKGEWLDTILMERRSNNVGV